MKLLPNSSQMMNLLASISPGSTLLWNGKWQTQLVLDGIRALPKGYCIAIFKLQATSWKQCGAFRCLARINAWELLAHCGFTAQWVRYRNGTLLTHDFVEVLTGDFFSCSERKMKNGARMCKSKCIKKHHARTTFVSSDVEKLYAAVARSTCVSENAQSTQCSDHSWKFRCRKIVRRCGAKPICKSKCTKHSMLGPFFGSSDVEKLHVAVAGSTFVSQNAHNTACSDHFWKFRCPRIVRGCGASCGAKRMCKSKCEKHEG